MAVPMRKMALAALCCFAAILSQGRLAYAQEDPQYPSLVDALTDLGLESLLGAVEAANLTTALSDPDLQVILLAPTEAAFAILEAAGGGNITAEKLQLILLYHAIPTETPFESLGDAADTYPTLLQSLEGYGEDSTIALGNITITPLSSGDLLYAGAIIPGGLVGADVSFTAGKSRIYLVDNVLLPPVRDLLDPPLPLTLAEAVQAESTLSVLAQLIAADEEVAAVLSDPDASLTVFAPSNEAILAYAANSTVSIGDFLGSPELRRILRNHLIPTRPYTSTQFPNGSTIFPSASFESDDVLNVTVSGEDVTVSGTGSVKPAKVISANLAAGKSVIHIIDDLILPSTAPPSPDSPPSPPDSPFAPPLAPGEVASPPPPDSPDSNAPRDLSPPSPSPNAFALPPTPPRPPPLGAGAPATASAILVAVSLAAACMLLQVLG